MKVLASVLTHGQRAKLVGRTVDSIRRSTVPVDVVVWCNDDQPVECGVPVLRGTKHGETDKLAAALTYTQYDFYCHFDDDVLAAPTFIERALAVLKDDPGALVCTGGSVIVEGEDPARRKWCSRAVSDYPVPQMYVDLFDAWAFVLPRHLVGNLLHFEPGRAPGWTGDIDIWWGPSFWTCGGAIVALAQPPAVLEWCPEHYANGMSSQPRFAERRTEAIKRCLKAGWKPQAQAFNQ
jgi:hypothetical protein